MERRYFLYVVIGCLIGVAICFCVELLPHAPSKIMVARQECKRSLYLLYTAVRTAGKARLLEGRAVPRPFSVNELAGRDEIYCPVTAFLTSGKLLAPLLVVYSVKRRGSDSWESPNLNLQPPYPIAFVSRDFGPTFGEGLGEICFSDGSLDVAKLPTCCGNVTQRSVEENCRFGAIEVLFPLGNPRFPYAKTIAGVRAQYLGGPLAGTP
jgi:hypothetical protein